ncbi:non-ribosomal peptide synthetase [Paenibacillus sonchi]|uniref:non-ribosomal peptide synthetase n=1 Tax=Paenibacillus sonchi TaxID=373687 RepID=UPI001E3693B1|nr:non-ribosomal peptide synthetase [Paenibacillus sonchi]MCE3199542.1 amino acid adenylation domain-containing protein [Paenibacillus sonchi]
MHRTIQTPRDEIEEKLKAVWREVLQIDEVGINDHFFEVGGHSLKALELEVRIGIEFDTEISLENIFGHLTIKELADYICSSEKDKLSVIKPALERAYYPVSWTQKNMYFSTAGGIEQYVMDMRKLDDDLDPDDLEQAFYTIIKRHRVLRTTFEIRDEEVVQRVHDETEWFRVKVWEAPQEKERQEAFIRNCVGEFDRPYSLHELPLFRIGLIRVPQQGCLLLIHFHHIIFDAYSIKLVYQELECIRQGKLLPPLHLQYADYCLWQKELEATGEYEKRRAFWLDRFAGEHPQLNLPFDRPRSNRLISAYGVRNIRLKRVLIEQIYNTATRYQATPSIFLTAVYGLLLSKYTAQSDISLGILSSRRYSGLENSIGVFIRPLPIRFQVAADQTFSGYLEQVKKQFIGVLEHQECDVNEIEEEICRQKGVSRTEHPLYRVSLNFHTELESILESLIPGEDDVVQTRNTLDIACGFYMLDAGDACLNMEYNLELFDPGTIERMGDHFMGLLEAVLSEPERKVGRFSLLSHEELHQIMHIFNDTASELAVEQTLQAVFEQQAEKSGDSIAVKYKDRLLTYRELNQRSNQLSRVLMDNGVGAGSVVGIWLERSLEMMVGLLAILKAGGAYLPIGPDYPPDRVSFVLEDSQAGVVLIDSATRPDGLKPECRWLNIQDPALYQGDGTNPAPRSGPGDLAYIIYTSGSTGTPKGVMVEHRSVINRIAWMHRQFPIGEADCILQKTPYTFDVSVWELFGWYYNGASLCFLLPGTEKDPEMLLATIAREQITLVHFVPSLLNGLLSYVGPRMAAEGERLSSLRYLFVSGETLLPGTVNLFNQTLFPANTTRLINLYGPTEATVEVSWFDCSAGAGESESHTHIPIGKPIDNIRLYIVNGEDELQPIGVPGELLISGIGVARGYVNRAGLTADKFCQDPWVKGNRIYRTGDLARWMPDGNIGYLGRMDEQVKIRGVRIELGEIENTALQWHEVEAAVAAVKEISAGDQALCLYYVPKHGLDSGELRSYLGQKLPRLMVPDYIMEVPKIPLNSSGKADRKLLPVPEIGANQAGDELPADEIELKLAEICREVLHLAAVGVRTNLFSAGANSLRIILMAARIRQEMGIDLPVSEVYTKQTIAEIAAYIRTEVSQAPLSSEHDLILIHKGAPEAPFLFFIHDISGSIDAYFGLAARLGDKYTCYGVPAETTGRQWRDGVTVEELAKSYLAKIKKIQEDGPYSLAGWSLGGLLAYETAKQIEAEGDEVNMLALIDSSHPGMQKHLQTPDKAEIESFRRQLEGALPAFEWMAGLRNETTLYGLYKKLARHMEESGLGYEALETLVPVEIMRAIPAYAQRNTNDFYHYVNLFLDLQNAYVHYNPARKVFAQAYLIKAAESRGVEANGWNAFFYRPVIFREVEGDHYSVFREPDLAGLAEVFETIGVQDTE